MLLQKNTASIHRPDEREILQIVLQEHDAHVYNNWTQMPPISEQIEIAEGETASFSVSRFLLKPGTSYSAAVEAYLPYKEIKQEDEDARNVGRKILEQSLIRKRRSYLYVNNRLEGCAPLTIDGMLPRNA